MVGVVTIVKNLVKMIMREHTTATLKELFNSVVDKKYRAIDSIGQKGAKKMRSDLAVDDFLERMK